MPQLSPNEGEGTPLDIDELEDAIAGIEREMGSDFRHGPLSVYQTVAMLQRLRPMPETQLAAELQSLHIPRRCYNRLCALKHDLLHHTRVDIDEVPDSRQKKKSEKEKKLHADAKGEREFPVAGGLEMTAQEAIRIITHDIGNTSRRIQALIDDTPKNALSAIPSVVRDLETASAEHYAEIERRFGLGKDDLLAAKRALDAESGELPAKAKKAVESLETFYAAQYKRIMKEHGLERPLVIRWAMALKADPEALHEELMRRREEEVIEADENYRRIAHGFQSGRSPAPPAPTAPTPGRRGSHKAKKTS